MRIARVFPTKTSFNPTDQDCYFGSPDMFTPDYDQINISVTFTWDKPKAEKLALDWKEYGEVRIGGCAYDDPGSDFVPGKYLRKGIVITSRGCPNNCSFCYVPKREGKIRELPITEGNIVQDNNILACSKDHLDKVFSMLKKQKGICFKGGLESSRLTNYHIDQFRSLSIKELWFACDHKNNLKQLKVVSEKLKRAGFKQYKLLCYVLCGKDMAEEENRIKQIFEYGFLPFAQLYKDSENSIIYDKKWRDFVRIYSRPAIYKSMLTKKEGLNDRLQ